jgi:hypothetical protein
MMAETMPRMAVLTIIQYPTGEIKRLIFQAV